MYEKNDIMKMMKKMTLMIQKWEELELFSYYNVFVLPMK